jgi:hypothetical protein
MSGDEATVLACVAAAADVNAQDVNVSARC